MTLPMTLPMTQFPGSIARRYAAALNGYLADGDEAALTQAYELGRAALREGFGLLDLTILHHQILAGLLLDQPSRRALEWLDPAAVFLAECLAPFEMMLRGYRETNESLSLANEALTHAKGETDAAHARLMAEAAERERAETALRQTQRLHAVGQLSGGIAHHFNNLLTVIMGNVHMARRRVAGDARLERLLDSAALGAEHGATVTRQLLAFSRRQMLRPEAIDPSSRLAEAARLMAGALGGAIVIETDIPDDLWPIEIDATELDLALINLGLNARDAMGGHGVLRVAASNRRLDDPAVEQAGDYLVVEVCDNGKGIDPENLARVFDPFFTTKGASGTGLGLSQVYGFANQSGGAVAIESVVGEGTTVRLSLPASRGVIATPDGAQPAWHTDDAAGKGVVLVVDDDVAVAGLAAALLEECGFQVKLAYRAGAALELLSQESGVDLLFSDIVMPGGMDGIALAEEVRRHWPALPILLTSGYSEAIADGRAEARGFTILAKPYKPADLQRGVMGLLKKAA